MAKTNREYAPQLDWSNEKTKEMKEKFDEVVKSTKKPNKPATGVSNNASTV